MYVQNAETVLTNYMYIAIYYFLLFSYVVFFNIGLWF